MNSLIMIVLCLSLTATGAPAQEKTGTQGSLRGSVQDQEGKPVADVRVRAISRQTDKTVADVTTNHEGKFTIPDLPEGRYALVFYSPSYEQATVQSVEVKTGQQKRLDEPVRLKPVKLYAVVDGAVFDGRGYLVPGARVLIERIPVKAEEVPPVRLERTTNSSGEFAFRLPASPARYRLTASVNGHQSGPQVIDIGGSVRRHVSLQLESEP